MAAGGGDLYAVPRGAAADHRKPDSSCATRNGCACPGPVSSDGKPRAVQGRRRGDGQAVSQSNIPGKGRRSGHGQGREGRSSRVGPADKQSSGSAGRRSRHRRADVLSGLGRSADQFRVDIRRARRARGKPCRPKQLGHVCRKRHNHAREPVVNGLRQYKELVEHRDVIRRIGDG